MLIKSFQLCKGLIVTRQKCIMKTLSDKLIIIGKTHVYKR